MLNRPNITNVLLAVALLATGLTGFVVVGTSVQQSPSFVGFMSTLVVGLGTLFASINSAQAKANAEAAKEVSLKTNDELNNGVLQAKIEAGVKRALDNRAREIGYPTEKGEDNG